MPFHIRYAAIYIAIFSHYISFSFFAIASYAAIITHTLFYCHFADAAVFITDGFYAIERCQRRQRCCHYALITAAAASLLMMPLFLT